MKLFEDLMEASAKFADKATKVASEAFEQTKVVAGEAMDKGKKKVNELELKGELSKAYKQLGELYYVMRKTGETNEALMTQYYNNVTEIQAKLDALLNEEVNEDYDFTMSTEEIEENNNAEEIVEDIKESVTEVVKEIKEFFSKDETVNILEGYSSNFPFIEYYYGKNMGPAKSFWELINKCEEADYYALCDQDDMWLEDKLSAAVEKLQTEDSSKPLLYCSRYTLTDENLNPINSNVSRLYNFTDFPHSLIYHTAPGCTFVFNNETRKQIIKYDVNKEYCMIHDAIIHKVVAIFGKVILDQNSHILYRQHGNNEIGMNANVLKVFVGRVNRFLTGKIRNYRSNTAKSLLKVYGDECSPEQRQLLNTVANYMNDRKLKRRLLEDDRFKSHTGNDFFFKILVLINYI